MIPERNMKQAKRLDNGEIVQGYYCPCCTGHFPLTPCIVPVIKGLWEPVIVDENTVEDVAVLVICDIVDENGIEYEYEHYKCPNCLNILHQHYRKSKEPMRYKQNYCHDCGQRIYWSE